MIRIWLFTIYIAIFSTALATIIGIAASFFTSKRRFFFRKTLLSFSAVPLCIPTIIVALGYVSFFGMNGRANSVLKNLFGLSDSPVRFLYSSLGIIIAQGFYNFPLVMSVISRAWENLDSVYENQARLLGAGEARIFFTVTLPRLRAAIISAIVPVFLFCYFSFLIVLLFSAPGTSTLEVEIYRAARNTLDLRKALSLSGIETVTALLIVLAFSWIQNGLPRIQMGKRISSRRTKLPRGQGSAPCVQMGKRTFGRKRNYPSGSSTDSTELNFTWRRKPAIARADFESRAAKITEIIFAVILFSLIIIFFVSPFLEIIVSSLTQKSAGVKSFSFVQFQKLFSSKGFWISIRNTIVIAPCTGLICCAVGFAFSSIAKINGKSSSPVMQTIPMLPMAISSVVLGFLITLVVRRGNPVVLILAQSFIYWPLSYKLISASLSKISLATEQSALLLGTGKMSVIARLYLPRVKGSLSCAFCYCFAVSCGDTTLPLVLAIPNFDTLALYTYRLAGSYRYLQASASAVVLGLLCVFVFTLGQREK